MKWIEFAENCNVDSEACFRALNELNECLVSKSVLVGGGLTPSEADVFVFSAIYTTVVSIKQYHHCYIYIYIYMFPLILVVASYGLLEIFGIQQIGVQQMLYGTNGLMFLMGCSKSYVV